LVQLLAEGTELDSGALQAPDTRPGAPFVVNLHVDETPHGQRYQAKQNATAVLLTVVDPVVAAQSDVRARLQRDMQAAAKISHRSLLPIYGTGRSPDGFFLLEAAPSGVTVRAFAQQRKSKGKSIDVQTAYTLVAHVCNALAALHEVTFHGYITSDTVWVSEAGRVLVSSAGIGACLPLLRNFERFRRAGRLPNVAPEQLLSPPTLSAGTDICGVGALFIELLTGKPLAEAGQPVSELGLHGPADLIDCLERATAPSADARPPDMAAFKAELSDAIRSGELVRAGVTEQGKKRASLPPPPPPSLEMLTVPGGPQPGDRPGGYGGHPQPGWGGYPSPPPSGYPPPPPPGGHQAGYAPYPPGYGGYPPGYPSQWPPNYPPNQPAPPYYPQAPQWPQHGAPQYPGYPGMPPGYPPPQHQAPPYPPHAWPAAPGGKPVPAPLDPDQLRELDAATRRIADTAEEAVGALTQLIDESSESMTRPQLDPADPTDSSMLGLRIGDFEQTADRLATLDGKSGSDGEDEAGARQGPSESGTFFSSFAPKPDHHDESGEQLSDSSTRRVVVETAHGAIQIGGGDEHDVTSQRPIYFVVRGDELEGPLSMFGLAERLRSGSLRPSDTLRHRTTKLEKRVDAIAAFRDMLRKVEPNFAASMRSSPRGPRPSEPSASSRSWGTLVLVLVVILGFGVAGWFMWQRTQGG
jgi:serine/threonine protein kinase